jgi:hypothetical protein
MYASGKQVALKIAWLDPVASEFVPQGPNKNRPVRSVGLAF